ncbi:MAG: FAD-dependent oxidoreductase [Bacteroidetes bacterium]|nr:FAD-dependent oxidoreductase [Fibrella sp.]
MKYTEATVCQVSDLQDGQMKEVKVGETDVLIAKSDGEFFATHAKCTHYQAPLATGILHNGRITCPWHNACFDLRSGHRLEAPALNALPAYAVRIEGANVLVRVPDTADDAVLNPMVKADNAGNAETYVVVGGGGAAAFAAEALRQGGFAGRIVLISAETDLPYDRPNCSKDYLQGEAPDEWMPLRDENFYRDYGIELRKGQAVASLNATTKAIELANGEVLSYDKALICTGGKPRRLDVPGTDLDGVRYLRTLTDSQQLRNMVTNEPDRPGKRVVIVGSSFIGLEGAMSLRKLGCEVDVVGKETVPFEKIWGARIGRVIQGWHEAAGIRFHLGRKTERLEGNGTVEAVVLDNGERLAADLVLIGLGVTPSTDFVREVPLEEDGGIKTDAFLNVADGLYAAGDIAHYPSPDGPVRIEHWKVAGQQGHVAGLNMAGRAQAYDVVPFFWSNQQGKRLNYIGHATRIDDIVYDGSPEADESFLAFYVQDGEIKAATGLKRDADMAIIQQLMREKRMPSVEIVRKGVRWAELL